MPTVELLLLVFEPARKSRSTFSRGHMALFVNQFDWSENVDFSIFQGLLEVVASGKIAATVIQSRPSQFATLPVSPR